jgi:hypothetical protein
VETVRSADGVEFTLDTETSWRRRPSSGWSLRDALIWLKDLDFALGYPKSFVLTGVPHWHVVLKQDGLTYAESAWSDDWSSVEQTVTDWKALVLRLPTDEIRRGSSTWGSSRGSRPRHLA